MTKKHLKRYKAPKNWPIARKGKTFVVRPNANLKLGVPILIILRDMLKIAANRKEVKKAIRSEKILLNNKKIKDEKNSASIFDVISDKANKKNHRLILDKHRKFSVEEVSEKETLKKPVKIINKKILKGKKLQLNLFDGRNVLSNVKCKTNDSLLINLLDKKIEKCLELKEKANVFVFGGKHAGARGIIKKIDLENKMVEIEPKKEFEKNKIHVLIKQIMVVE